METRRRQEDINIACNKAKSFPDGIEEAFRQLENTIPESGNRPFYGLSKPEVNGQIVYRAAVLESKLGEAVKYGFEPFTISKGLYLTVTIKDWMSKPNVIGDTFMKLLEDPRLDPTSYCIEEYKKSGEVVCMVKLLEN